MNMIENVTRGFVKRAAETPAAPGIWERLSGVGQQLSGAYNKMPVWAQYAAPAAVGGVVGALMNRKNRLGGGVMGALLSILGTYGYRNWPRTDPDKGNPYSAAGGAEGPSTDLTPKGLRRPDGSVGMPNQEAMMGSGEPAYPSVHPSIYTENGPHASIPVPAGSPYAVALTNNAGGSKETNYKADNRPFAGESLWSREWNKGLRENRVASKMPNVPFGYTNYVPSELFLNRTQNVLLPYQTSTGLNTIESPWNIRKGVPLW